MASVFPADGVTSGAPRRGERIVARRGEDAVILLDPDSGNYYTLDDVGGRIWELCDGSRTVDEIADLLAAEYDAPAERIRADVIELLSELRDGRLVSH
jgi:coenzyme PQQ biosynthesis protein PqqD